MSRVTALVPDLLFGSKVKAMLEAAGHEVTVVGRPDDVAAGADVLVVDLASGEIEPEPVIAAAGDAKTLAFYAHVDVEVRKRAERAGFDLVVPRSRMAREGAALVSRLAGD